MVKTVDEATFVPGEVLTYQIVVTNTGTGTLFNPVIVDDLGTSLDGTPLSYVSGSASVFLYNNAGTVVSTMPVAVATAESSATFNITGSIPQGNFIVLTYETVVDASLDPTVVSILNQATFTGNEGGVSGPTLTMTASEGINRETVTMVKSVSDTQVSPGNPLTYTLTLTNIGATEVTINRLVDQLPANFEIDDTIVVQIGANTVNYDINTDYTVTDANLLTIDPALESPPLSIPAATETEAGITVINISGTVTA